MEKAKDSIFSSIFLQTFISHMLLICFEFGRNLYLGKQLASGVSDKIRSVIFVLRVSLLPWLYLLCKQLLNSFNFLIVSANRIKMYFG